MAATYDVVAANRAGHERVHRYTADDPLAPGSAVRLEGRDWLIERIDETADPPQAIAKPGRYRMRLRHPDGREEIGAFRRFRPDRPGEGHQFTTIEDGGPVSWVVSGERLATDEAGEPYLDLLAERDYGEYESLPDHQLEHAMARDDDAGDVPAALTRAEQAGLAVELVALDAGETPDWDEAVRYVDALELEEIEDDLLELCGVRPGTDSRSTWLATVKTRLSEDLAQFREDVETAHDQIEEWEFRDGRIFASVGSEDDESAPDRGHGWMCRLADSGVLGRRRLRAGAQGRAAEPLNPLSVSAVVRYRDLTCSLRAATIARMRALRGFVAVLSLLALVAVAGAVPASADNPSEDVTLSQAPEPVTVGQAGRVHDHLHQHPDLQQHPGQGSDPERDERDLGDALDR